MAEGSVNIIDGLSYKNYDVQALQSGNNIIVSRSVDSNIGRTQESYTVPITNTQSTSGVREDAAIGIVKILASSDLDNLSQPKKQEYLTSFANNIIDSSTVGQQKQLIESSSNTDTQNVQHTPVYDYSKDLENSILNPGDYETLGALSGQVAKISRASIAPDPTGAYSVPGGITVNERNRKLDGDIIIPYKNINNETGEVAQYDTIGGCDMTCFLIMEYVPTDQLSLDPLLQQKDMLMIEMDSVLSISYSTIRERFPVRQLGKANPVAITAGVRTIAGHIAFAVFTEDVLGRLRSRVKDESSVINSNFKNFNAKTAFSQTDYDNKKALWDRQQKAYNDFLGDNAANAVTLLDSLPPFHMLVMGVNEQGTFSQFMIKGISIVDENQYQGTQQPNIINKVSFVACDLVPMQKIKNASRRVSVHSANSIDESYSKGVYNGNINYNYEVTGSSCLDSIMAGLRKERV